jgi:hypothetical protein
MYKQDYMIKVLKDQLFAEYSTLLEAGIYECGSTITTFVKTDNCKAEFSPTITSCADSGLPLSIFTDTQLDASTKIAFTEKD